MARGRDWDKATARDRVRNNPRVPAPIVAWWLTLSKFVGRCDGCGEAIAKGTPYAYNHAEGASRCQVCVDREGISARPSKRLLVSEAPATNALRRPVSSRPGLVADWIESEAKKQRGQQ